MERVRAKSFLRGSMSSSNKGSWRNSSAPSSPLGANSTPQMLRAEDMAQLPCYVDTNDGSPAEARDLKYLLLPQRTEIYHEGGDEECVMHNIQLAPVTWMDDLMGLWHILKSWLNLLLIMSPLGLLSHYMGWPAVFVFWLNFFALIPLASLLGNATEELALHSGDIIGGLLNATFGNAIEMIIAVQALKAGLIYVVQGTLIGSILSNLLLVLGMAFFAGGLKHHVQRFNEKGASCSVSLLFLSCMSIIVPTVTGTVAGSSASPELLMVSRLTSVLVSITYCLFLFFQLHTHLSQFQGSSPGERGVPQLSKITSAALLFGVTIIIACHSEFLVGSIEAMISVYNISESFIGIILLPIVGNGAEHLTAVSVAMKNKVDLTMGVAVGSSVQIALFVVPFTVISGWVLDQPMTLVFSPLLASVLIMSVIVLMAIVQDGESNWLEGALLITAYLIVGVVFWYSDSIIERKKL